MNFEVVTEGTKGHGTGRKWTGQDCILPLAQAHGDPIWILTPPKLDVSVKEECRESGLRLLSSSRVGGDNMTLQCTKSAGHWKVGGGMGLFGKWGV